MKIYTRTGDKGMSSLYSGERLPKSASRFDALGTLDELNASLGIARAAKPHDSVDGILRRVQELLFELGADVATVDGQSPRITSADVQWMETAIDEMTANLPELRAFILPGGTPAAAAIHGARGICRRAERLMVATEAPETALAFLNRLSDLLFTAARLQNHLSGVREDAWIPKA